MAQFSPPMEKHHSLFWKACRKPKQQGWAPAGPHLPLAHPVSWVAPWLWVCWRPGAGTVRWAQGWHVPAPLSEAVLWLLSAWLWREWRPPKQTLSASWATREIRTMVRLHYSMRYRICHGLCRPGQQLCPKLKNGCWLVKSVRWREREVIQDTLCMKNEANASKTSRQIQKNSWYIYYSIEPFT